MVRVQYNAPPERQKIETNKGTVSFVINSFPMCSWLTLRLINKVNNTMKCDICLVFKGGKIMLLIGYCLFLIGLGLLSISLFLGSARKEYTKAWKIALTASISEFCGLVIFILRIMLK